MPGNQSCAARRCTRYGRRRGTSGTDRAAARRGAGLASTASALVGASRPVHARRSTARAARCTASRAAGSLCRGSVGHRPGDAQAVHWLSTVACRPQRQRSAVLRSNAARSPKAWRGWTYVGVRRSRLAAAPRPPPGAASMRLLASSRLGTIRFDAWRRELGARLQGGWLRPALRTDASKVVLNGVYTGEHGCAPAREWRTAQGRTICEGR